MICSASHLSLQKGDVHTASPCPNVEIGLCLTLENLADNNANMPEKDNCFIWACCGFGLLFVPLAIAAIILSTCKGKVNARWNEFTTAVIIDISR